MMKVAIFTLTMNRLLYTKTCVLSAMETAHYHADYFVLDQGSLDGTPQWIRDNSQRFKATVLWPWNVGINRAHNALLSLILSERYDLVMKLDNDCFMRTGGWLRAMVSVAEWLTQNGYEFAISPRVEGLRHPIPRQLQCDISGQRFGKTHMIGGISLMTRADWLRRWKLDENTGLSGNDDAVLCQNVSGCSKHLIGYLEDFVAEHYETTDGQGKRFPEYFFNKRHNKPHWQT